MTMWGGGAPPKLRRNQREREWVRMPSRYQREV